MEKKIVKDKLIIELTLWATMKKVLLFSEEANRYVWRKIGRQFSYLKNNIYPWFFIIYFPLFFTEFSSIIWRSIENRCPLYPFARNETECNRPEKIRRVCPLRVTSLGSGAGAPRCTTGTQGRKPFFRWWQKVTVRIII